jgi:hypothetical protein
MISKLLLSTVLATATVTAATLTPAPAQAFAILPHHHFEVLVRRGDGWEGRGTYRLHVAAEAAAVGLRHRGYRVEIRQS